MKIHNRKFLKNINIGIFGRDINILKFIIDNLVNNELI